MYKTLPLGHRVYKVSPPCRSLLAMPFCWEAIVVPYTIHAQSFHNRGTLFQTARQWHQGLVQLADQVCCCSCCRPARLAQLCACGLRLPLRVVRMHARGSTQTSRLLHVRVLRTAVLQAYTSMRGLHSRRECVSFGCSSAWRGL